MRSAPCSRSRSRTPRWSHCACGARSATPSSPSARRSTCASAGLDVPLFAGFGGLGTAGGVPRGGRALPGRAPRRHGLARAGHGRLRRLPQEPGPAADRDASSPRPRCGGPAIEIEYRTVVLHVTDASVADEMTATALRLASERHARVVARVRPSRCPPRGRSTQIPAKRTRPARTSSWPRPRRSASSTACRSSRCLVRTRNAGPAPGEEADPPRQRGHRARGLSRAPARSARLFGSTVDYVPAPRALQGDGRRHARMARCLARRRSGARCGGHEYQPLHPRLR